MRQVVGLVLSAILYMAGWAALRLAFGSFVPAGGAATIATVISIPIVAPAAWGGFLLVGAKVRVSQVAH